MSWSPRFLRALVARLHPIERLAPALQHLRANGGPQRHTAPGFGMLVIGHSDRDAHIGR